MAGTLSPDWHRFPLSSECGYLSSHVVSTTAEAVLVLNLPRTGWEGQGLDLLTALESNNSFALGLLLAISGPQFLHL